MSSITSLSNSPYYQLSGNSTTATTPGSASDNATDALLQALSSSSSSSSIGSSSDAYLLDLSPQAQQYLSGIGSLPDSSGSDLLDNIGMPDSSSDLSDLLDGIGLPDSSGSDLADGSSGSFVLSSQQQQAITAILQKYKDAPYTQDTFDQIQNDLTTAGLSPNILGMEDQAKNFNPTGMLIDDLDGNYDAADALASPSSSDEQSKETNYMQQIIQQWQSISTTASQSANSVTPAASASGA